MIKNVSFINPLNNNSNLFIFSYKFLWSNKFEIQFKYCHMYLSNFIIVKNKIYFKLKQSKSKLDIKF